MAASILQLQMGPLFTAPGMTIAPARSLTDHLPICHPKMLEGSFISEGMVYLFIYLAIQFTQLSADFQTIYFHWKIGVTGLLARQL